LKYLKCNFPSVHGSLQKVLGLNTEFCHVGVSGSNGWAFALRSECFGDVLGEIRITCPTAFRCAWHVRRGGKMS